MPNIILAGHAGPQVARPDRALQRRASRGGRIKFDNLPGSYSTICAVA